MAWPSTLQVALKEWDVICHALESGRQMVLLRKGGVFEASGEFELEHRQFLLFPTFVHQKLEMLKPEAREIFEAASQEPAQVKVSTAGVVTDILRLDSRAQMESLDAEHVWAPALIDMRFDYKPRNPLYLLLVRAHRLAAPIIIDNTPAYAGCKSWAPLHHVISTVGALPVLDDPRYEVRRGQILRQLRAM